SRLTASVDYYDIKIKQPIITPDVNVIIAACYNYYGTNAGLSAANPACQQILRLGGDILAVVNPSDPNGYFPTINGGRSDSSGLDMSANWAVDLGSAGNLDFDLGVNHVFKFEQQDRSDLPTLDYVGTVAFFGEGLGSGGGGSVPDWKATLSTTWDIGSFSF